MSNDVERRKHCRVGATFVVSYKMADSDQKFDLSQTSNFSQGGILLTTSCKYNDGDKLDLKMMVPPHEDRLALTGQVHECIEIVNGLIYKTRVSFKEIDESTHDMLTLAIKEFGEYEIYED